MNDESARLETFNSWPSNATVNPQRVAKAGFYYTGPEMRVVCFSCGCIIDDWQYGDQAMARHRDANPLCRFVMDPERSGNIPLLPTTPTISGPPSVSSSSSNTPGPGSSLQLTSLTSTPYTINLFNHDETSIYRREAVRLASYLNSWPPNIPINPERLARAGFFYTNIKDKVQCAFCSGILSHWEEGDDPDFEHGRHFPQCPFIKNPTLCGNIEITTESTWDGLVHHGPKNSEYITLESRLNSFSNWLNSPQRPEILADAGLYYTGMLDEVRCFHCDGGLRNWQPDDDPWVEHARWFPKCPFIRLKKGETFIQEAMNQKPPNPIFQNSDDTNEREAKNFAELLMNSEIVQQVMSIGFTKDEIRKALVFQIRKTGRCFETSNDLVSAILDRNSLENQEHSSESMSSNLEQNPEPRLAIRPFPNSQSMPCLQSENKPHAENKKYDKCSSLKNVSQDSTNSEDLEEENRRLKEARICKICMDAEVGVVYVPCGHLVTCIDCAANLEYCPMCRVKIQASVKTYLS